jgi:hypothetical protein
MLEGFGDGAVMEFRGAPAGPYVGKEAIRAAYRERPPDGELRVLETREREGGVDARYAWLSEPDVAAGELLVSVHKGRISKLVVTFDRDVSWV